MIRHFCDLCGAEITEDNAPNCGDANGRLGGSIERGGKRLRVSVLTALDGVWNAGDVCRYCVIDAVNSRDDRPQALPQDRRYDELADALGCDCMDSHEGRLERARRLAAAPEPKL